MAQLVSIIIVLPLAGFYLWMFRDMIHNQRLTSSPWMFREGLPDSARFNWTFAFIFLNVFGALLYYLTEYRSKY
jgi:hypothetical protein